MGQVEGGACASSARFSARSTCSDSERRPFSYRACMARIMDWRSAAARRCAAREGRGAACWGIVDVDAASVEPRNLVRKSAMARIGAAPWSEGRAGARCGSLGGRAAFFGRAAGHACWPGARCDVQKSRLHALHLIATWSTAEQEACPQRGVADRVALGPCSARRTRHPPRATDGASQCRWIWRWVVVADAPRRHPWGGSLQRGHKGTRKSRSALAQLCASGLAWSAQNLCRHPLHISGRNSSRRHVWHGAPMNSSAPVSRSLAIHG